MGLRLPALQPWNTPLPPAPEERHRGSLPGLSWLSPLPVGAAVWTGRRVCSFPGGTASHPGCSLLCPAKST